MSGDIRLQPSTGRTGSVPRAALRRVPAAVLPAPPLLAATVAARLPHIPWVALPQQLLSLLGRAWLVQMALAMACGVPCEHVDTSLSRCSRGRL